MADQDDYRKSNREKTMESRRIRFWCYGCDRCEVTCWQKCPICGTRNHPRRFKNVRKS